ncbi:MAG: acyl-ACP desaturase [Woeseiaceae bacterium]|nr:acyl-ACP desaturase [Woeseiaceae bacterium]
MITLARHLTPKIHNASLEVGGAVLPTDPPEFQRFIAASRPLNLEGIDWDEIPSHPVPDDIIRILAYMQDVESHTVVFPRTIFSQRAVDDEFIGTFLICWLYEEGMHGRALAKFLACAGHPVVTQAKRTTFMDHVDRTMTTLLAAVWKEFLALHMAWGAVHECTTIHAYQRMMQCNDHPVLNELLRRIVSDEARHFSFYMWQAGRRLADRRAQRIVRAIMDRMYVPVGTNHQPDDLARWVSGYLFDGEDGRAAARRVDRTIARLPGFSDARFLGDWLAKKVYN